jgi:hypothetical protein
MIAASRVCFVLLRQTVFLAAALAWAKTGKRMAAKIAMIAITTRSSIRVNPVSLKIHYTSFFASAQVVATAEPKRLGWSGDRC